MKLANSLVERDTLGKGVLGPLKTNETKGGFVTAEGSAKVKAAIEDLIGTQIGERVMKENIGSRLTSALFEDGDAIGSVIAEEIKDTINEFEPRVTNVQAVSVTDPNDPTTTKIKISWRLRSTGEADSMVYPGDNK